MLIDIHTHLNLPQFDDDRAEVIERLRVQNIGAINVGTSEATSRLAVELAEQHDHLWATVGHHPGYVDDEPYVADTYRELAAHPRVVGIGECGFDYFRTKKTSEHVAKQTQLFRQQIELAIEFDKPLMLHLRPSPNTFDAYDEALELLQEYKAGPGGDRLRGDAHFFAGTVGHARQFIKLGFMISFTGVVTFADEYADIIREIPLDKVMCETDAPYVAPTPYRGSRCSPEHVVEVYEKVAEIKGGGEATMEQLANNAKKFWGLD